MKVGTKMKSLLAVFIILFVEIQTVSAMVDVSSGVGTYSSGLNISYNNEAIIRYKEFALENDKWGQPDATQSIFSYTSNDKMILGWSWDNHGGGYNYPEIIIGTDKGNWHPPTSPLFPIQYKNINKWTVDLTWNYSIQPSGNFWNLAFDIYWMDSSFNTKYYNIMIWAQNYPSNDLNPATYVKDVSDGINKYAYYHDKRNQAGEIVPWDAFVLKSQPSGSGDMSINIKALIDTISNSEFSGSGDWYIPDIQLGSENKNSAGKAEITKYNMNLNDNIVSLNPIIGPIGTVPVNSGSVLVPTSVNSGSTSPIEHVIFVPFENHGYNAVTSSGPYFKYLADTYGMVADYEDLKHAGFCSVTRSLPNYMAITSGTTLWNRQDKCDTDTTSWRTDSNGNIFRLVKNAGLTYGNWKESNNVNRHIPATFYTDTIGNLKDYSDWDTRYLKGNEIPPNFSIVTPNMCHSAHDCEVSVSDDWLKNTFNLSALLQKPWAANTVFIIWFDESENEPAGYLVFVSPHSIGKRHTEIANPYHLLTTMEWLLGLGNTGNNDDPAKYPPMKDLFES